MNAQKKLVTLSLFQQVAKTVFQPIFGCIPKKIHHIKSEHYKIITFIST